MLSSAAFLEPPVSEFSVLSQIIFTILAVVGPIVVAVRLVAGGSGMPSSEPASGGRGWPRGVQEEEPLPWRFVRSAM